MLACPAYDNLETMSKFLALGMDLHEIVRATTLAPARWLRRPDLGDLSETSTGDATILRIQEGAFTFTDSVGKFLDSVRAA